MAKQVLKFTDTPPAEPGLYLACSKDGTSSKNYTPFCAVCVEVYFSPVGELTTIFGSSILTSKYAWFGPIDAEIEYPVSAPSGEPECQGA